MNGDARKRDCTQSQPEFQIKWYFIFTAHLIPVQGSHYIFSIKCVFPNGDNLFSQACCDRTRRFKLKKGRFRLDIRKIFFTMRVVKHWPGLPQEVMDAPSLKTFKARLDGAVSNLIELKMSLLNESMITPSIIKQKLWNRKKENLVFAWSTCSDYINASSLKYIAVVVVLQECNLFISWQKTLFGLDLLSGYYLFK